MAFALVPRIHAIAGATTPRTRRAYPKVLAEERVAAKAVRLASIDRGLIVVARKEIFALRYCVEMVGVHARLVKALVVDLKPVGNGSMRPLIRQSMGVDN